MQTGQHHQPLPDRIINQAKVVTQEAEVDKPQVGQLGLGKTLGLMQQKL